MNEDHIEFESGDKRHTLWFDMYDGSMSVYVYNANELRGVAAKLAPEAVTALRDWLVDKTCD